ncbi:hypothetical protein RB595_004697 [Gaeumannomyces hyphopodioides]
MEAQVMLQPAAGPGASVPEELAPPPRPRKIPMSPQHEVPSPPDSDTDGASTDAEDDNVSEARGPATVKASLSAIQNNAVPQKGDPTVASAPADGMLVVSESMLREMMRQEVENILKTIQSPQRTASVPESKPPLPSVYETRPSQSGPSHPLAPFQASVADAPETPSPDVPTSPVARHASVSSTTRTGSFSGAASSPRSPTMPSAGTQPSVSDEKWGRLFDQNGQPTARAEEVFKSVADHIIAEFVPRKSIVVTPEKLAEFYSRHGLPNELFPFANMFSPRALEYSFFERVSDLYDDLGCQYHLVPKDGKSRPVVPALTPTGFSQWLITNIKAYPEEEARRLAGVVLQVPLSVANAADGKLERMPRMISRGLLPEQPDIKARKILDEALKDFVEDSEVFPVSPSGSRHSGLNLNIPGSSTSRLPAVPIPPHRDPNRYKPRDQHYPDRGVSSSNRREPRGSGYIESADWSTDGNAGSRHGSIPLSPTSERDKTPLQPPPVGRRARSPQTRRHSHTAVNVMQSHPPPMTGGAEYAQPSSSGGLLSPKTTHASGAGGGPTPSSPNTLSPEQLATIRDRSPRHGRDKDYYNLQRSSYFPSRTSRTSFDGAVLVPGQMPRSSGSYREYDHEGAEEANSSRRRRRGTAASEDAKGHGWDEAPRHKGK